jgi:hypothetical protein
LFGLLSQTEVQAVLVQKNDARDASAESMKEARDAAAWAEARKKGVEAEVKKAEDAQAAIEAAKPKEKTP